MLLGIAGAVLGTQCPLLGAQFGICPAAVDVMVTGSAAASPADPAASPAATTNAPAPAPVPAAPASAPEKAAATLSAHELIESSHELLLAQAERPLLGGRLGTDSDAGNGTERAGPVAPAQLSYAPAPEPAVVDRAMAQAISAEFGGERPVAETEAVSVEPATLEAPVFPALPDPEPLSLRIANSDADEAPATDEAEAPSTAPEATAIRIGESRVNVRAGPSTEEAKLFGLDPGTEVMATGSSAGWTEIEDAAGRVGWIHSELLAGAEDPSTATVADTTTPADPPVAAPEAAEIRIVAGAGVNVREAPSNSGTSLFALAAGEEVTVTGSDKGWLRIVDSRSRTGWAYSDFLSSKP